jgi:glycosyltransferase involved in cell wall biosynthesis
MTSDQKVNGAKSERSVAIIYDKFLVQGGGERVCEILLEAFPDAKLYALNAHPRKFWETKLQRVIVSPKFGSFFYSRAMVTFLYPVAAFLMSTLKINADIILAYSSTCGKYVRLGSQQSILYSNYPNRGLYQLDRVIKQPILRAIMLPVIALMVRIERRQISKFRSIISISETSRKAMVAFAGLDSTVLMPPFDERDLAPYADTAKNINNPYFILVSRLEPEKEIEYVIDAFKHIDMYLKVVGTGSLLASLKDKKIENVEFLGYVEDAKLATEIAGASALIFPSDIEYSLVPIEANYLGTPVIAYASDAARDILVDIHSEPEHGSAMFFHNKTSEDVKNAVSNFGKMKWSDQAIRRNAERFQKSSFIEDIRRQVLL